MDTKLTAPTVKILRLRERAEISLRVIAKIIQERMLTGWENKYDAYNDRWINQPAWIEHIDKWDNKWDKKGGEDKKDRDRDEKDKKDKKKGN